MKALLFLSFSFFSTFAGAALLEMQLFNDKAEVLGRSSVNIPTKLGDQLFVETQEGRCELDSLDVTTAEAQVLHLSLANSSGGTSINGKVDLNSELYFSLSDKLWCKVKIVNSAPQQ